jgi:DNA polymerase I-like protein with 3'-5' exonuclease and polymerase domains
LFGVSDDCYQIGYDFSGLEARIEGHYTVPYEGGQAYAESLVAEKPHDCHTIRAAELGITRDEAKTLKYAISYGAQVNKIASQMDWSKGKATEIFEGFWDSASPLKELKEDNTAFWMKTGKKFIKGIDGRKLWIRSEHSILNMLFQSTGVIAAKKANIFHNIEMRNRGLLFNPFRDSSWDRKAAMMIHYH